MNIIFLTMSNMHGVEDRGIYADLMRKFRNEGHRLCIVAPRERRTGEPTSLQEVGGVQVLGVRTLNLQKTNVIEKGAGQVLVESQFNNAIKKHLGDVKFDLILYSTPPITLMGVVKYLKKKNPQATTYLLLKDIFPQNAVDIGMMSKTGVKGLLYKYFRKQEKQLYKVSDYIGCMSPANVDFIVRNNPEVDKTRVEVCPNSLELVHEGKKYNRKEETLRRFGIPSDRPIFIYGGNLGKPQGIDFLVDALEANSKREDCHFLIIGDGTEYGKIESWIQDKGPKNVTLIKRLPKDEYDELASYCDVGLICLDHRFTIPNFPSRLLAYLENHKPVVVATDPNCDMGPIAQQNGFGYWCESNSVEAFTSILDKIIHADRKAMGERGYRYLCENYLVDNTYQTIVKHLSNV